MQIQEFNVGFSMGRNKTNVEKTLEDIIETTVQYSFDTFEFANNITELTSEYEAEFSFRYKENESLRRNWTKFEDNYPIHKIFNDTLGLRFVCKCKNEELDTIIKEFMDACPIQGICRSNVLAKNGYQGIHLYIKKDNTTFPIEVQFWTRRDTLLNRYLRDTIYTRIEDQEVINYAEELRKWLNNIPNLGGEFEINTYIDYIYEKAFQ